MIDAFLTWLADWWAQVEASGVLGTVAAVGFGGWLLYVLVFEDKGGSGKGGKTKGGAKP